LIRVSIFFIFTQCVSLNVSRFLTNKRYLFVQIDRVY